MTQKTKTLCNAVAGISTFVETAHFFSFDFEGNKSLGGKTYCQAALILRLQYKHHFKAGPILERKAMLAIFQKRQNIWKFGQKYTKSEHILKKGRLMCPKL